MPHTQLKSLTVALSLSGSLFIARQARRLLCNLRLGDSGRILSAEEAVQITDTSYSPADVSLCK